MKNLILIIAFSTFLFLSKSNAQNFAETYSQVKFPNSPTAASLGKYGEYPVNLQNGMINISIPLETVTSKSITVPISLSYHASGIKVDDQASWVGLGWSLNAGGVITRKVIGGADEKTGGFYWRRTIRDASTFDGDIEADFNELKKYAEKEYDAEPDVFYISAPGIQGSFRLANDGKAYSETLNNIKIDINFTEKLIEITTADGTLYRFGKNLSGEEAIEETDIVQQPEIISTVNNEVTSAWFLTEIISPNRDDIISFHYNTISNQGDVNCPGQKVEYVTRRTDPNTAPTTIEFSSSISTIGITGKKLSEIHFNGGKLIFNPLEDRADYPLTRLSSIDVFEKLNGNYSKIRTIELLNENSYFVRQSGNMVDLRCYSSRNERSLKLGGVKIKAETGGEELIYGFEYSSVNLPARETTAQDYWGYYNGETYNDNLVPKTMYYGNTLGDANRSSNAYNMKAGVLEKIIYPTQGWTEFDYEPNYYLGITEENSQTQEISISQSVTAYGYVEDSAVQIETKLVDEKTFITPHGGYSTLTYEFTSLIEPDLGYPKIELIDNTTSETIFSVVHHITDEILSDEIQVQFFQNHSYTLRATVCNCTTNSSIIGVAYATASVSYNDYITVTNPEEIIPHMAGGLRIKQIRSYVGDNETEPAFVKSYVYGDKQFGAYKIGTGVLVSPHIDSYTKHFVRYLESSIDSGLLVSSNSIVDFAYNSGSPVEYDKVTEYFGTPENNHGKKEYYYEPTDFDIAILGFYFMPYDALLYPKYKSGILTNVLTFRKQDENYILQTGKTINYTTLEEKSIDALKVVNGVVDGRNMFYENGIYIPLNYQIKLGIRTVTSKSIVNYDINSENPITQNTINSYENTINSYENTYWLLSNVISTNSKGAEDKTVYTYPHERAIVPELSPQELAALTEMKNRLWVSKVVQQEHYLNGEFISGNRVEFMLKSDTLIKPKYILNTDTDENYRVTTEFTDYDDFGNLIQFKDVIKDLDYSIIWGIENTYPIVKAIDVDQSSLQTAVSSAISGFSSIDALIENVKGLDNQTKINTWKSFNSSLRTSLADKNITTYCYSPLLGVTAVTDPNGKTSYYEYDNLGRLILVKDHESNILKSIEYKYQSN